MGPSMCTSGRLVLEGSSMGVGVSASVIVIEFVAAIKTNVPFALSIFSFVVIVARVAVVGY